MGFLMFGFFGCFFPFPSFSYFGVLLYTSCMFRGAFTLFIKFSSYLSKKNLLYSLRLRHGVEDCI